MTTDILKRFLLMIALCILQALILNRIHLFDIATPLFYLWLPIHFKQNYERWKALLWCFFTGLIIDTFSNTAGLAAFSLTLIGLLQTYILPVFISHEEEEDIDPSPKTLGWISFTFYSLILTFIYCLVFFTMETFSFFDAILWIETVGASTGLTLFLILAIEKIKNTK